MSCRERLLRERLLRQCWDPGGRLPDFVAIEDNLMETEIALELFDEMSQPVVLLWKIMIGLATAGGMSNELYSMIASVKDGVFDVIAIGLESQRSYSGGYTYSSPQFAILFPIKFSFWHLGIGRVSIMVESRLCWLSDEDEPGECHFDKGWYFVINGAEKKKGMFFFELQAEYGDIFKVTLEHSNDLFSELRIEYFDNITLILVMYVLKLGYLFATSEFGSHGLYQFKAIGVKLEANQALVLSTARLLKFVMRMFHLLGQYLWFRNLPFVLEAISGQLNSGTEVAEQVSEIFIGLVDSFDTNVTSKGAAQPSNHHRESNLDWKVIEITCYTIYEILDKTSAILGKHVFVIISHLFLMLGCASYLFTKGIFVNLLFAYIKATIQAVDFMANTIEVAWKLAFAAIQGLALGGGLEWAMAFHALIATSKTQFGLPELTLGVIPGFGGTQRLPRLVGIAKAMEMMLLSKSIKSNEAKELGLIDAIVSPDELLGASRRWALESLVHKLLAQRATSKIPGVTDIGQKPRRIKKVVVIGGGLMGSDIATALRVSNVLVVLKEVNPEFLQRGDIMISANLKSIVAKRKMTQAKADHVSPESIMELRLHAYIQITKTLVTDNIFSRYKYKKLPSANHLWVFKKQFAIQLALYKFMSLMLQIGHRTPNKILFAKNRGNVFQTNFHPAYDVIGRIDFNEPVPFRLTRNMQSLFYPMLEEYDFRNDTVNSDMKMELKPQTQPRPYQGKSLSKIFGNLRVRYGIIVPSCGVCKSLVGVSAACCIRKSCLCMATNAVSVNQWAFQVKLWFTIRDDKNFRFSSDIKERFRGNVGLVVTTYNMVVTAVDYTTRREPFVPENGNISQIPLTPFTAISNVDFQDARVFKKMYGEMQERLMMIESEIREISRRVFELEMTTGRQRLMQDKKFRLVTVYSEFLWRKYGGLLFMPQAGDKKVVLISTFVFLGSGLEELRACVKAITLCCNESQADLRDFSSKLLKKLERELTKKLKTAIKEVQGRYA